MEKIPAYVISLDTEKYKKVEKEFSALGVQTNLFPAVYGKNLSKEELESLVHPYALYTIQNGRRLNFEISTLGAVGCSLSHIKLWQHLLNSGEEAIHVLEDDANVSSDKEQINKFLEAVPSDWELVFLGFGKSLTAGKDLKVSEDVYRVTSYVALTHSYIINRRGAEKLLAKALPIVHAIDAHIPMTAMYGGLVAYRPSKQHIKQAYTLYSSVQLGLRSPVGMIRDMSMTTYTSLPSSVIILSFFIALFSVVSYLIKKAAKLVR